MTPLRFIKDTMPKSDSSRSKIRDILNRRKANSQDRLISGLKEAARAALVAKGVTEDSFDYRLLHEIANGDYGTPEYILRNLVQHLPNHTANEIVEAYEASVEAGIPDSPDAELLTEKHISTYKSLFNAYVDAGDLKDGTTADAEVAAEDFEKIMHYALNHLEDGPFITVMVARGFSTLQEVLEFLPTISSSHVALSEGAL